MIRDVKTRILLEIAQSIANEKKEEVSATHLLQAILLDGDSSAYKLLQECGLTEEHRHTQLKKIPHRTKLKRPDCVSAGFKKILQAVSVHATVFMTSRSLLKHATIDPDAALILQSLGINMNKLLTTLAVTRVKRLTDYPESPILNRFALDLTEEARRGTLDPIYGRETEVSQLITTLCRRIKRNVLLIGEAGTGKTAIVEGFAQRIVAGRVPDELKNRRVMSLDVSSLVAGTKFRGDFEERINAVIGEVVAAQNIILFIDEIHRIIGAGDSAKGSDAANTLKPYLARGKLQVIGATTPKEEREVFEKDHALERRFQRIKVVEPTEEDTVRILQTLRPRYESFHGVSVPEPVIKAAVSLSIKYVHGGMLPDKAIDLLDQACANKKLLPTARTKLMILEEKKIKKLEKQIQAVMSKNGDILTAAEYSAQLSKLKESLEVAKAKKTLEGKGIALEVGDIAAVVSSLTGIPITNLGQSELEKLRKLDEALKIKVVGQDKAVETVAKAIKRSRLGIRKPGQPIGSFLFLGPTGTGKSHLAKKLAEHMFGSEKHLRRFDMTEYSEKHTISRLLGAPPSYIGYEEGGELINALKDNPYSVVLFDEVEKAHPDIYDIFLQILDDGRITDKLNRTISLENCIIVMTSNIGSGSITSAPLGFGVKSGEEEQKQIETSVMQSVKQYFRPEFLNRLSSTVVFNKLGRSELGLILDLQVQEINETLMKQDRHPIELTEKAKTQLLDTLMKEHNANARPLRRLIRDNVEDTLTEAILADRKLESPTVVDYIDGKFKIQ